MITYKKYKNSHRSHAEVTTHKSTSDKLQFKNYYIIIIIIVLYQVVSSVPFD